MSSASHVAAPVFSSVLLSMGLSSIIHRALLWADNVAVASPSAAAPLYAAAGALVPAGLYVFSWSVSSIEIGEAELEKW